MFDFLRNLGRTEEEKRQEMLNAYLDGELAPSDRQRLDEQLARDPAMQSELQEMRLWQQEMRALPRRRAPRNFTLDPALYGPPQRRPLAGAYPVLRGATALAAFLFIAALAANLFFSGVVPPGTPETAPMAMMEMAAEEAPAEITVEEAGEASILEEATEAEPAEPALEAGEAALLPQATRELLPGLELLQDDGRTPFAGEEAAAAAGTLSSPLEAAEASQERAAAESNLVEAAPAPDRPVGPLAALDLALIILGLLFVLLAALTLAARRQR